MMSQITDWDVINNWLWCHKLCWCDKLLSSDGTKVSLNFIKRLKGKKDMKLMRAFVNHCFNGRFPKTVTYFPKLVMNFETLFWCYNLIGYCNVINLRRLWPMSEIRIDVCVFVWLYIYCFIIVVDGLYFLSLLTFSYFLFFFFSLLFYWWSPSNNGYQLLRYRPFLPVAFVHSELAFVDEQACQEFLKGLGLVLNDDLTQVDCKQSQSIVAAS